MESRSRYLRRPPPSNLWALAVALPNTAVPDGLIVSNRFHAVPLFPSPAFEYGADIVCPK